MTLENVRGNCKFQLNKDDIDYHIELEVDKYLSNVYFTTTPVLAYYVKDKGH